MNSKMVKTSLVLALTATPVFAHATSGSVGINACAAAMVSELAENQGSPMVYNLDPEIRTTNSRLKRREVIHLDARDPDSHEIVARVDCIIDAKAKVRKLIQLPVDGPDARFRATSLK